jgi:ubiquinone/menaquinone biosynthesis C-methylase UbiE
MTQNKRELVHKTGYGTYQVWYHHESIKDLNNFKIKKGLVLDLGCGEGPMANCLKRSEFERVYFDISRTCLHIVMKKDKNGEYVCGDALFLPFRDQTFHVIICHQLIEHLQSDKILIKEVTRILRTGGFLILSTVIKGSLGTCLARYRNEKGDRVLSPDHLREYSSMEEIIKRIESASSGLLKVLKRRKKYVRFPLKMCRLFLIPIPLYYYDAYIVLKKMAT